MNDLLIIDMLPTYGLLFYLLISVFVFVGCRGLRRRTSDRGLLRFAVGAFLVVSALGAVFAALVYIMAVPLAQPDMVDFYRTYRPGALIFLLGLFIIFGVAAVYRGKVTYGEFTLVGFAGVFELDGDEDELEVGEEGLVEPVVAGGGLAVVLHAVEDAFDHVPPAPGDADGPGSPFFGAPAACRWTFTLVEFMASTRISTPMIRSSCNAVNRRSIAPFPDQRSTLMNRSSVMPYPGVHTRQSSHKT